MSDFYQFGPIATIHDLGAIRRDRLESLLVRAASTHPVGLILPVTAADMRAEPFRLIIDALRDVRYVDQIVVTLNVSPDHRDFEEARHHIEPLGYRARVLWTDGPNVTGLYEHLNSEGLRIGPPGKGRAVWTAFGYLLGDPRLKTFVLHDCDIGTYDREVLARLCLPMVHPSFHFEYCKAYYARYTDRMHGRVVRLLVTPLLQALESMLGDEPFLRYLVSFRYPLAGEFAISSTLASSMRIPSDWGLEIGILAEVFRNTSVKRVCQVDLCDRYDHKHQPLSLDDPERGLMKMANDILVTIFHTLASRGVRFSSSDFVTLRSAFLRVAQDLVRHYNADALVNGLRFDRHEEELAVEAFAQQIVVAGERFRSNPTGSEAIPNWSRVLAVLPDFPQELRHAVELDESSETLPSVSHIGR